MSHTKTAFEHVVDFNHQFGVLSSPTLSPNPNILTDDPALIHNCLQLIREEMSELETAIVTKDFTETIDALGDIIYVVLGMGARCGVDMDEVFRLIHDNNMSKICTTEQEAKDTILYYKTHTELGYSSPVYRLAPNGSSWVVYNERTNKVLKSVKWKPVDIFSTLIPKQ